MTQRKADVIVLRVALLALAVTAPLSGALLAMGEAWFGSWGLVGATLCLICAWLAIFRLERLP